MRTVLLAVCVAMPLLAQEMKFAGPRPEPSSIAVRKEPQFDLYRPAGDAVVPVMVFANVGNPALKDWDGYIGWGQAVAGAGLAAVLYNAERDTGAATLEAVMTTLKRDAAKYKIDASRVVIWCGSSNVLVGLPYAMDAKHSEVRGLIVYYGDAPVEKIRLDLPVLLARAGRDVPALNERIDALVKRALAENAPWTVLNVAAGVHGFDVFEDDAIARDAVIQTLDFAKRVTDPATSRTYVVASEEAANAAAMARKDWDAAIAGYTRSVAAHPNDATAYLQLGVALSEKQRYAEALTALERAWDLGRRGPRDTGLPAAVAAAGAGNVERAVFWLDRILATPFVGDPASYRTDPRFAKIRDDPAFIAVIEKHSRR